MLLLALGLFIGRIRLNISANAGINTGNFLEYSTNYQFQ